MLDTVDKYDRYIKSISVIEDFALQPIDKPLEMKEILNLKEAIRFVDKVTIELGDIAYEEAKKHQERQKKEKQEKQDKQRKIAIRGGGHAQSKREKVVDFIRINGKVTETEIYRKFKMSRPEAKRQISLSYGMVSYTIDDEDEMTYHFIGENYVDFETSKYKGKLPEGHHKVGNW